MAVWPTEAWWLAPAAALACAAIALAPLGEQVLARGVVFVDLAVAQAAAAAALCSAALLDHPEPLLIEAAVIGGALACAGAVAASARRWPAQREALIGLIYVLGAAAALLGATLDPHGRERVAQLLAADVLWADAAQVAKLAAAAFAVLALRLQLARDAVFFPLFAVVAAAAVQALGLFVVFALLIAPALWQRAGLQRPLALALTLLAVLAGLGVSWLLDAPSGPSVAAAAAVLGLGSMLRKAAA